MVLDHEIYDEYDISGMNEEELIHGCKQAINDKEWSNLYAYIVLEMTTSDARGT